MDIQIKVDVDIRDELRARLTKAFNCQEADLPTKIQPYAIAALNEYIEMFVGERVPVTASELMQRRLLLLIQYVFKAVPVEQEIARLFQTTPSQSRTLLRNVLSKNQYQLDSIVTETLKKSLQTAVSEGDDNYVISINCKVLLENFNRKVAEVDSSLPAFQLKANNSSRYLIKNSTYNCLSQAFGIQQPAKHG